LIACSRSSAKKIGRSYVITRELCQVAEPHGGQAIFECLDKVMPGLARRKR